MGGIMAKDDKFPISRELALEWFSFKYDGLVANGYVPVVKDLEFDRNPPSFWEIGKEPKRSKKMSKESYLSFWGNQFHDVNIWNCYVAPNSVYTNS